MFSGTKNKLQNWQNFIAIQDLQTGLTTKGNTQLTWGQNTVLRTLKIELNTETIYVAVFPNLSKKHFEIV